MKSVKDRLKDPSWPELVRKCHLAGVDLSAHHMGHSTLDGLQSYVVWAAVVTEVHLDVLTGQSTVARCDLTEDTGSSISPEVDIGQVEGGLVLGLGEHRVTVDTCHVSRALTAAGLWTSEQLRYHPLTGALLDNSTWYYHVPSVLDIPATLRTQFYNSGHNPAGVLGSKTTGEPSVLAGCSVLFAIR